MKVRLHFPRGIGLLTVGSGIYWILSSQLIGSPTALAPRILNASTTFLLLIVGVACVVGGIPVLVRDAQVLRLLFERADGWLFTIPMSLAAADLELTLIGLSTGKTVELNAFVSATTTAGPIEILLFLLSYLGLSEGLGLLMLGLGRKLCGSSTGQRYMPYALVCGVAGFGPFSDLSLIIFGSVVPLIGYVSGIVGSSLLSFGTYSRLRQ